MAGGSPLGPELSSREERFTPEWKQQCFPGGNGQSPSQSRNWVLWCCGDVGPKGLQTSSHEHCTQGGRGLSRIWHPSHTKGVRPMPTFQTTSMSSHCSSHPWPHVTSIPSASAKLTGMGLGTHFWRAWQPFLDYGMLILVLNVWLSILHLINNVNLQTDTYKHSVYTEVTLK